MKGPNYWERAARRTMHRRTLLKTAGSAAMGGVAIGLVGCGSGDDNGNGGNGGSAPPVNQQPTPTPVPQDLAVRGGTFRFNGGATLDIWDPHWNASSYTLSPFLALVYNKLYKWQSPISSGEILPDLAQSLPEQPDETTYVIKLREGVRFHNKAPMNGRELTAEDVKWNIERQRDADDPKFQRKFQYQMVTSIETPDTTTVVIKLSDPLAPFLSYLASQWAFIIGPEVVEQYGDANREEAAIGTGPFVFKEFQPGNYYHHERNPDYFLKDQPYFDAVQSVQLADAAAVEAAFRTKKIDYTYLGRLPYPTVEQIRADIPDIRYEKVGNLYFDYYRMLVDRPPFNDARVRQAMSAALSRQQGVDFAWYGHGYLNGAGVPSTLQPWGFDEEKLATFPGYPNASEDDIRQARQLMEAAGYSDSNRLRISVPTISPGPIVDQAEVEKEDLAQIYIDVEIVPDTFPSLLTKQTQRDMSIWRAQDNGYEDPDDYLYGTFYSESSRNFLAYKSDEIDALLLKQRRTLGFDERRAIVNEIQEKLMSELPQIGISSPAAHYLSWPYLRNRRESEWLNMYQIEEAWIDPNDPTANGRPS